jgi:hypothetical protein
MICGKPLTYLAVPEQRTCEYCHDSHMADTVCADGHFVCDRCHRLGADDAIEQYCHSTTEKDPVKMAITLMLNPEVNMHGPEHHFLVPAVLLAAYCNTVGNPDRKSKLIAAARERSGMIRGGACGFLGDCGAAVGTGIFISLITGATPLSRLEWQQANLVTAKSLETIARHGGPRCCKRNTFLAIQEAVVFVREQFHVNIRVDPSVTCIFSEMNRECRTNECPFYPLR